MKIGASTACLYPMITERALSTLVDLGIRDLEIFFNTSSELEKSYIKGLKRILRSGGCRVHSVHPYSSGMEPFMFFSNYERRFTDMMDDYQRYFYACRQLGASIVVIHGDKLPGEKADEKYFERFNMIMDCGKKFGVTVAQENVNLHRSQSPEFLQRMKEWIGPDLKFVFDVKQAVRANYNPYYFAEKLGDAIIHVHVSDNNHSNTCMLPGKGVMDYAKLKSVLEQNGCDPTWVVEVYRKNFEEPQELVDAVKMLKQATKTR